MYQNDVENVPGHFRLPPPLKTGGILYLHLVAFSFGVACGAKQFLYLMLQIIVSRSFCFWVARRDNKLEHFVQKTIHSSKNEK